MWKRGIGWTFVVVLALTTPGLAQERETISITVRLRNDAGISESVIGRARAEAVTVFSAAGVQLIFVTRTPHLTIVLLSSDGGRRMHQVAEAMGYAPSSGGQGGRIAYVLSDRVEQLSHTRGTDMAAVLGVAVAHELGHLLLPSHAHTEAGVMRKDWNRRDFQNARDALPLFTPEQVTQLRVIAAALSTTTLVSAHP
jgi:hypothetical protein